MLRLFNSLSSIFPAQVPYHNTVSDNLDSHFQLASVLPAVFNGVYIIQLAIPMSFGEDMTVDLGFQLSLGMPVSIRCKQVLSNVDQGN